MGSFENRVARLFAATEQMKAKVSKYAPFVELRIFSIIEDAAAIIYRPRGLYGDKVRTDGLTIREASEKADEYQAPVISDLAFCCEWSHAFYMRSGDYAATQKETFKANDMKRSAIQKLYELPEASDIIDMLAELPQVLQMR